MKLQSLLFSAIGVAAVAAPAGAVDLLYTLENSVSLPNIVTGYDYIKMQPGTSRLFIARDQDGLTVFDVDTQKVITTVENSQGANGPLLLPEYNRGYIANTDGSLSTVDLKTLKQTARLALDKNGGLNSAIYDPVTKQVHAIVGTRPKESNWYTLDAATGKLLKTTTFPFAKMDDPATDGKGRLFAPARRDKIILTLDSKTLKETARWDAPCNVSKVRFQARTNRILGACGGDTPSFFALDATSGKLIAKLPIGKGIDGFGIDEKRNRIVASNHDGTLTVIGQEGADTFKLLGSVSSQLGARMMTMDERNGRMYLINVAFTETAPNAEGKVQSSYHPNTFVILTYKPI
ncbi:YncE family protein [Steroidobacter sp.]|uniref:YncE family protein n=1 Tax=Steroidobacter sp. TaxID=1978227 RepID=UPI001A4F7454|nr:hypothetical protein [Steroidobacter sp.]MBL8269591.1 hypothetical protein [Steroidobacter sp.]